MKLTAVFLFAACLHVSARTEGQVITLSVKNKPLEKVLAEIKKQSGFSFIYGKDLISKAEPVTVTVKDEALAKVLDLIFQNQTLTYKISDNYIVISPKTAVFQPAGNTPNNQTTTEPNPPIDISGKITDSEGNPLAGANVKIKGTNIGTTTDANGVFILKGIDENAVLEISFVGFETQTISVKNKTNISLELKRSESKLDEVQVIAYGITIRRLSTGNVSSVKAADIEKQPVNNPLLALQGRVPGLFITQSTGLPGTGVIVRIQGQNSISGGNDPFYVIDGVPYPSQMVTTTQGGFGGILSGSGFASYQQGGQGNPLSYINPSDIESIEVLKDADATSIYGSRAANGAILITTKKGKAGQTKIDINLQNGWGKVTRSVDMMNTQQYLQMRKEALSNDGIASPSSTDYDINGTWDTTRYTDWRKVLIGGTAKYTNLNASVSGGSGNIQFLVGGTYHRETTVYPGDFSDQKGSLHFNVNGATSNQKFHIQLSGGYLIDNNQLPRTDLTGPAYVLAPNAPALYNADGSLNWAPTAVGTSSWTNPLAIHTINNYQNKTNNLISNALLRYQILPGLEIMSSFGYTNLQTNEISLSPLFSAKPENRPFSSRFARFTYSTINTWLIEPQLNYKRVIGKGKVDMLIGTTIQQNNNDGMVLTGVGQNSDAVLKDLRSAATVAVDASIAAVYKYNAIFGRINYNWLDKYIINLTIRRDGSSRFGSRNQFHNFASAAAGWVFTQEDFIKKNLPFISFGKLKASYGTTGNDQIGDYRYMNLYSSVGGITNPYQGAPALSVSGLQNPYLQWEETRKLSFGLDLGFLRERILLNSSYSVNRSSNQLLQFALPVIVGVPNGIIKNFPATVQNSSWELALNTTNIKDKNFNWSSSLNITIPKNKLVSFPNLATSTYARSLIIGQPVTIIKGLHFLGVDAATGIFQFADSNGNPTNYPNFPDDYNVLINTLPKFYGGVQNSFSYKRIQVDILFQFVKQTGYSGILFGNSITPGYVNTNQPASMLNRWKKPGDIATIQRYNSDFSYYDQWYNASYSSDAAYSDASYIRLKNLSLSWQLPDAWMKKAHIQNCRIYVHGQNLLTITNFSGLDPETQSLYSLPPLRVLLIGLQVGL